MIQPEPATGSITPIQVLFALLPGSLALDWAGPAEALRIANQILQIQGLAPRFELHFCGPCADSISSVGLKLTGLEPLPHTLPEQAWVVLVGMPGSTTRWRQNQPVRCCTGCAACGLSRTRWSC